MNSRTALLAVTVTIAVAGVASAAGGGQDVSSTPFGTPTAAIPDPSANITAVRGDRMWDWTEQTRSEVLARHGIVATSQPLAAQAGLQILKKGGNAVDAAVATAAMLGLTEPESAGIGGDMEAIYYEAKTHHLYGLNAAGWAPASHTPAFYRS
ncbi:MAG: gamma-glutamyltransferase, partial [Mycobacteriales bacterium]